MGDEDPGRVCTPTKLTEKQKELLRQFAAAGGEAQRGQELFEKIKDFLGG